MKNYDTIQSIIRRLEGFNLSLDEIEDIRDQLDDLLDEYEDERDKYDEFSDTLSDMHLEMDEGDKFEAELKALNAKVHDYLQDLECNLEQLEEAIDSLDVILDEELTIGNPDYEKYIDCAITSLKITSKV